MTVKLTYLRRHKIEEAMFVPEKIDHKTTK